MSSIVELFPGAEAKVRRDQIRERYGIEGKTVGGAHILPCDIMRDGKLDVNKSKIQRLPLNDRSYVELEKSYSGRMLKDGYHNEDAGVISLVAANNSRLWPSN